MALIKHRPLINQKRIRQLKPQIAVAVQVNRTQLRPTLRAIQIAPPRTSPRLLVPRRHLHHHQLRETSL